MKLEPAVFTHDAPDDHQLQEERDSAQMRARVAEQKVAEIQAALASARDQLRNSAPIDPDLAATREKLLARAQLRDAEERVAAVRAELEATREELRGVSAQARSANAKFTKLQAELRTTLESMNGEPLESTDVAEAEPLTISGELTEPVNQAREAEAEITELRAALNARDRTESDRVQSILGIVGDALSSISDMPDRIKDALAPTADAMGRLGDFLEEITRSAWPSGDEPT
jgi:chromosome segregation ATPase